MSQSQNLKECSEKTEEVAGFEVLCRSLECVYNDKPMCTIHTLSRPIVIGGKGTCVQFEEGEGVTSLEKKYLATRGS